MPLPYQLDREVERAAHLLAEADGLLILAGAGMGVDSGLPDYRGDAGLWTQYPAFREAGVRYEEASSPRTFFQDPALAWGLYAHKLELYRKTRPHAGFDILLDWADRLPEGAFVFTSNIDGHFQKAGFKESGVQECHGSVHWLQCARRCTTTLWSARGVTPAYDPRNLRWQGEIPRCVYCDSIARPNVLMFGDPHWVTLKDKQQASQLQRWRARVQRPLALELGAGTEVPRVRQLSDLFSRRLIRVNPGDCTVRGHEVGLRTGALDALQRIAALLE